MNFKQTVILLSATLLATAIAMADEEERAVALKNVPADVIAAAKAAVAGIELTEAAIETEDGQEVYELEGRVNGKEYEIEVNAAGKVLEIESEEDDDSDDEESNESDD